MSLSIDAPQVLQIARATLVRMRFPLRTRILRRLSSAYANRGEIDVRSFGCRFRLDLRDHVEAGIFWQDYEPHLVEQWRRLVSPGALVLDVGANVGLYSLLAATGGATVHAFEPNPRVSARLKTNLSMNDCGANVQVFPVACSDKAGAAVLYDDVNMGAADANAGVASLSNKNAGGVAREVLVTTIDEHLTNWPPNRVDLMKLDIQGAELPALRGASRTLEKWHPTIMIEIDDKCAEGMGWNRGELQGFLRKLGYEQHPLDQSNHLFTHSRR